MSTPVYKRFKLCIFGDGGVGKTTLTHRYMSGVFQEHYKLTIGMDFHVKKLEVDGKMISLQIWDFAGERKFRFLLPSAVLGASGALFLYDMSRFVTFKNLNDWVSIFKEANEEEGQEVPAILIGSKLDLQERRAVPLEEGVRFANENNFFDYLECSSKSGANVDQVFEKIGRIMIQKSGLIEEVI
jgi:small GTP-binding protein